MTPRSRSISLQLVSDVPNLTANGKKGRTGRSKIVWIKRIKQPHTRSLGTKTGAAQRPSLGIYRKVAYGKPSSSSTKKRKKRATLKALKGSTIFRSKPWRNAWGVGEGE